MVYGIKEISKMAKRYGGSMSILYNPPVKVEVPKVAPKAVAPKPKVEVKKDGDKTSV